MCLSIMCRVVGSFYKDVFSRKKNEVYSLTVVEAVIYGEHKYVIEGTVLHLTKENNIPCVCLMIQTGRSKRLVKIYDKNKIKFQLNAFARVCAVSEVAPDGSIIFYTTSEQDPDKIFTMDGEPQKISLDHFGKEEWEEGVQAIALSRFTPFERKQGGFGFNYTVATG